MLTLHNTDPMTPHKRKTLRRGSSLSSDMVTEVTMTLSSSSVMEMPAKRQRTEYPDLPSILEAQKLNHKEMSFTK